MSSRNSSGSKGNSFAFCAAACTAVLLAACENPQPPGMCGAITDQTVVVGERATVSACFEDPNGDVLSYEAASSDVGVATVSVSGNTLTVTAVSPGTSVVTVTATDMTDLTGNQQFRVLVPNRAPVAVGEIAARELSAGESAAVDVSAHFMEPDGEPLTYAMAVSDESVLGISATGAVVTLEALAKGTATVTATATDPGGLSAVQSFLVTVPNRMPGAVGTIAPQTIEVDAAVTTDVTGYFTDPDGDELAYTAASSDPSVTEVSMSGGELTVTAIARGEAMVTVTATDTDGLTATQEFVVTVPNRAPLAVGSIDERTVEVDETSSLELSGYFSDPDGDVLVYTVAISDGAVAGVEVAGGALAVTALAKGTATVTVTATDTEGLAATQEFEVTVPNQPPFATGSIEGRTIEVGDAASLDLSSYFSDPDGDDLVYAAAASDAAVAGAAVDGEAMTVTAVAKGEATVTVTATDTEGLTAAQAFLVTVPNRAPLAVGSIEERTVEVGESAVLALPGYFEDPDGDALAYTVSSSDATRIGASVEGSDLTVTAVAKGDAAVTVTATDTEGLTATQTFAVTAPNQPPLGVGAIEGRTIEVGGTASLDLSSYFNDPDGDGLTYSAVISDGAVAGIEVSGRTLTVAAIAKGAATVAVTATDTEGLTATQEFAVTVPNRPPLAAGAIEGQTILVGEAATLDLSSHFSEPDGDDLVYAAEASDAAVAGVSVVGAAVTVTAVAKGEATVTVTATDTEGLSATQAFAVTIPNRPPLATGAMEERTLDVGEAAALDLSDYFSDPDGDDLAYAATSSDAAVMDVEISDGTLTVTALGKGGATVTITATDTDDESVTLEWVLSAANQAPLPVGSIEVSTIEVGGAAILDMSGHFTDPDGDDISYEATSSDATVASVEVTGNSLSVAAIARGTATVTITATDTEGMTATQEFTVTVPNRAPRAVGTVEPMELSEGGVSRINPEPLFADPDGDALVLSVESSRPEVARVWVASNGVLVRGVKKGTATVTITAEDPEGLATALQFNVRVKGSGGSDPNQPPVATGQILTQDLQEGDKRMMDASSYFNDPDNDALDFSASSSDTEVVKATTSGSEVELEVVNQGSATVTVTAEDPDGLGTSQAFGVTVAEATEENRAPAVVGTVADQALDENASTTLDASTYFTDPDGDGLTFSVESSDSEVVTVTVSGNDLELQGVAEGTATITLTAEDPEGLSAELTFAVTVDPVTPNRSPQAGTIPAQRVKVEKSKTLDAATYFTDPDDDDLTFTAASSHSNVVTVAVSGSDIAMQAVAEGTATITVTAEDPDGLTASAQFEVTIVPAGSRPPRVTKQPTPQTFLKDADWSINSSWYFWDPDDDYSDLKTEVTSSDATVLTAESLEGGTIRLTGKSEGEATITITVTDPDGLSASLSVVHTVGNNAPTVHGEVPDVVRSPDEEYEFFLEVYIFFQDASLFVDNDIGDAMTFSVSSSDTTVARAEIYDNIISLHGLITAVSLGEATITATATDKGGLSTDYSFKITVNSNRPPTVKKEIPDYSLTVPDSIVLPLSEYFEDPEGDSLTYTVRAWGSSVDAYLTGDTLVITRAYATMYVYASDPEGRYTYDEFEAEVLEAGQSQSMTNATTDSDVSDEVKRREATPVRLGRPTSKAPPPKRPPPRGRSPGW